MIKTKTKDLKGAALNWAAAQCEGIPVVMRGDDVFYPDAQFSDGDLNCPSESWDLGGPIIEKCEVFPSRYYGCSENNPEKYQAGAGLCWMRGETPLIAAMRAIVAHKYDDEIEVPDNLV